MKLYELKIKTPQQIQLEIYAVANDLAAAEKLFEEKKKEDSIMKGWTLIGVNILSTKVLQSEL